MIAAIVLLSLFLVIETTALGALMFTLHEDGGKPLPPLTLIAWV